MSFKKIALVIGIAIVLSVGLWIYYSFNPSGNEWFPKCLFREITGLKCPGCGSQRAIHALLNGNIVQAWHYNAMLLLLTPFLVLLVVSEILRKRHHALYEYLNSAKISISLIVIILLWVVLRNIFGW